MKLAIIASALPSLALALNNGKAITPPMGWNSWNKFGCNVTEELILSTGKAMARLGLVDLGYNVLSIDDCWHSATRDPRTHAPRPDPERFPNGVRHIVKELAKLGLDTGIYSSAGVKTCAGKYASLGYERIDAKTYAEWGIRHLKYDNCGNLGQTGPIHTYQRYAKMRDALEGTNITFAMCQWGEDGIWNYGRELANSYRITGDIGHTFDRHDDRCPCQNSYEPCLLAGVTCSTMNIIEKAAGVVYKSRPGSWGDLDSLEIGNGKQTFDEYAIQFSLWALVKSPLMLGHDVINSDKETLKIVSNRHIIAINQDSLGRAGHRIWKRTGKNGGSLQLWRGDLHDESSILLLINATPEHENVTIDLADFFFGEVAFVLRPESIHAYEVLDLWQDAERVAVVSRNLTFSVSSHAQRTFKLIPLKQNSVPALKVQT